MKNPYLTGLACAALAAILYVAMASTEYAAGFALLGVFFALAGVKRVSTPPPAQAPVPRTLPDEDLRFSLKIEMDIDEHVLSDLIARSLQGSQRTGGYLAYGRNVMTLDRNTSANREKAASDPEAWMYYAYELNVFPVADVDRAHQEALARELTAVVEKLTGVVEIVSEFEM